MASAFGIIYAVYADVVTAQGTHEVNQGGIVEGVRLGQ